MIFRKSILWLSTRPRLGRFVRTNRLARSFASRFVAGESSVDAVAAAAALKARGITATLDVLGESVTDPATAEVAAEQYLELLDRQAAAGVECNVSVKPTQMGLDLDLSLCEANLRRVARRSRDAGGFLRLDMESSAHTDRTLELFRRLAPDFGTGVGVVIQAALRRSTGDVERLIQERARVRLCKGAYLESSEVAFPEKRDVDAHYLRLLERLLVGGHYPAIATHDERILRHAQAFATREGIAADRFEFQMLYGVRRDLQEGLRAAGWRVRVYIPFGTQWYPYLMRRLAERPANIAFILGSITREALSGRRNRK